MESQNIPSEELITNNNKLISAVNDDQDKNQKLPSTLNEKSDTNSSDGKKKKNESFEEEDEAILYNDDDEENEIIDEYELMEDKKLRAMDDIKNMEERIKNNEKKIEELKNNLTVLKEEKNKKQNDIMNLLSNKESLEEIYKNQLYSLNNINNNSSGSNNFNENTTLANDINNLNNLMNDNSVIGLNSNHNITILDNEILNTDEENFKIELKEIKESEKDKFIEQVINMFEDIFKKKDENINKSITNIIKNSYELFINNNEENNDENNNEISVMNFFGKISLFIWNQNTSKFTESKINLLLRYLLKINYINTKLTKYLKFVNKKYKEKKRQILDLIDSLEKKNLSLKEKIARLENKLKEYEEKKILYDDDNEEEGEEEDELSHEVVIEYEDGIDKNAEINYEDEDIDDNDIEKENEMINKGENPYNRKQSNIIKNNKKNNKKNNNQIIVKDNDESEDKYLHEFLENNQNKKNKEKKNIINQDNKNNNENNTKKYYIKIDPKKDDENNKKKIKNINNEKNIINLDKNKRPFPTPQHHIRREEDEIQNLTAIEQNKYDRVQRIMNSGPKYGIFGVNKYNPENNPNKEGLFSPRKNNKYPRSSNKIDKTFKIESRQNHNFFGIINMTKVAAIKKKKNKKTKENEEENEGEIKIINLEENFNNEEGKEDTINVNNDNNENNNDDIIKDNNNNRDNEKRDNNKEININQNKNNIQGYYLNIINKKKVNNNEDNINNNNLNNNNNNSIKKEIKMHKLPHQPYTSSRLTGKKSYKFPRTKDLNLNNDNNTQNQIINKIYEAKPYLNINTSPTYDKKLNDLNKRSNSFSVNQNEEENNKNLAYRNQFKTHKIMVINNNNYKIDNINNYNTSPTNQTVIKKISRIPMSKMIVPGNKNYNANAYEKINFKAGGNKYQVLNKNKK
jgi:hypothetical protein